MNAKRLKRRSFEDLSRAELRVVIASEVAINTNAYTPFGKLELNSIHWYLTGEPYFEKAEFGTPLSPEIGDIRQSISVELDFEYFPPRPFRRAEIQEIADAVSNGRDRRPIP